MKRLLAALRSDLGANEISLSTSRNIIATIAALYLVWHFIATLGWPQTFSVSLWAISLPMALLVVLSWRLLTKSYLAAQALWLLGLASLILIAYLTYRQPEILILLVFLPLMAIVTVGFLGTLLLGLFILALMAFLPALAFFPFLSDAYRLGIALGSLFAGFFGWSLSSNLLSAIDASTFHYKEARRLLQETRQHRAQISRMLKDRNQTNYQLERLNQMLQAARQQAEEARLERDRFVLAISHELRSPLNFIIGFSDLMVNSPETYASLETWPAGLYEDIREIYRSSTHLLSLINDILDLGQIDAQRMTIFREKAHLEEVVAEVREMVAKAYAQKGLYLRVECQPDLPPVFIDRTRIRQVLLNLLNNGLRFTERGGVTIRLRREESALRLEVADTGPGIAEEDLPKVFQEFRQVGLDPWRRREGSGLGLAISRRFVQLHGGTMGLQSALGQGTTFYFTIPLLQSPAEPDLQPAADWATSPASAEAERPQSLVLLFSSNPWVQQMTRQWLDTCQIAVAEDLRQMPERVLRLLPQAVLVDKALPGAEAASPRDLPYPLPIIRFFCPGAADSARSLPPGVSRYLVKPVSRQALLQAIRELGPSAQTLLVVEDDPAMSRFIAQALKSASPQDRLPSDYRLLNAATGEQALSILQTEAIDALLLDLGLPDMSGWDLLENLRKTPPRSQPRVIIISALDLPQVYFHQGRVVLDLSLNRPLSPAELSAVLKPLVEAIRPVYPKLTDLNAPAPPASLSASPAS